MPAPSYPRGMPRPDIAHLLGKAPERLIARLTGVPLRDVTRARKSAGLAAFEADPPWTEEAYDELGAVHDVDISASIGLTREAVRQKRESLGILPAGPQGPRPRRGEHAKTRTIRLTDSDLEAFERMSAGKGWRAWAAGVLRKAAGIE
jgi:hypothetical protein